MKKRVSKKKAIEKLTTDLDKMKMSIKQKEKRRRKNRKRTKKINKIRKTRKRRVKKHKKITIKRWGGFPSLYEVVSAGVATGVAKNKKESGDRRVEEGARIRGEQHGRQLNARSSVESREQKGSEYARLGDEVGMYDGL